MTQSKAKKTNPVELQSMTADKLLAKAKEVGAELEGTEDAATMIAAIVEAQVGGEGEASEVEAGQLFSLHSRDASSKKMVHDIRNRIAANADAGRVYDLFLKNKEGSFYPRKLDGVRVSRQSMKKVLKSVVPVGDEQEALLTEYRENPDQFQDPLLVKKFTNNGNGPGRTYVMLYLRKKQARLVEQVF